MMTAHIYYPHTRNSRRLLVLYITRKLKSLIYNNSCCLYYNNIRISPPLTNASGPDTQAIALSRLSWPSTSWDYVGTAGTCYTRLAFLCRAR